MGNKKSYFWSLHQGQHGNCSILPDHRASTCSSSWPWQPRLQMESHILGPETAGGQEGGKSNCGPRLPLLQNFMELTSLSTLVTKISEARELCASSSPLDMCWAKSLANLTSARIGKLNTSQNYMLPRADRPQERFRYIDNPKCGGQGVPATTCNVDRNGMRLTETTAKSMTRPKSLQVKGTYGTITSLGPVVGSRSQPTRVGAYWRPSTK